MSLFHLHRLLPAGLLLAVSLVQAQAGPVDPTSSTILQYRSAIAQYRNFAEQPVASWIETNDTVSTVGGWRAYAKEASQPDSAAGAAPVDGHGSQGDAAKADADKSMPASHSGHGGKQ